jgi:hypothetical protein
MYFSTVVDDSCLMQRRKFSLLRILEAINLHFSDPPVFVPTAVNAVRIALVTDDRSMLAKCSLDHAVTRFQLRRISPHSMSRA